MLIHTEVVNLHYMRAGKRIKSSRNCTVFGMYSRRSVGGTERTNTLVSVHRKFLECCCIDSGGRDTPCFVNLLKHVWCLGTAVAQWLRCCATNRKVVGSIPDGVIGIFH